MKTERRMALLVLPALLLTAIACQSTGGGVPPERTANEVASLLVAGDTTRAEEQFRGIGDASDRARAYPVLYDRARAMWEQGDHASCIRINRFLVAHYPDRVSAREALLYALFLDRARTGKATDGVTRREMAALGTAIRTAEKAPPIWVDLALAQVAIDGGDNRVARASMTRFRSLWNGRPASLGDYARELDRWLKTHADPGAGPRSN